MSWCPILSNYACINIYIYTADIYNDADAVTPESHTRPLDVNFDSNTYKCLFVSEKDEHQIFVKFFKFHCSYDLIPTSAKLVVFDTQVTMILISDHDSDPECPGVNI